MSALRHGNDRLILGTGASSCKDLKGLLAVVESAIAGGIHRFDTAPSYGTESVLGQVLMHVFKDAGIERQDISVQSKIDAWQMQETGGDIRKHVERAIAEMQIDYLDLLLIHWPVPEYMDATWEYMVRAREQGLTKQIGICNVRMRQLEQYSRYNELPQVIQIERNPLRICEKEVLFCNEHGIEVQAYSPLCKMDERIRNSTVIRNIAAKYYKSEGQVVLRWHQDTGVVPVFTSTKPQRILEYADIFDFSLTEEEKIEISSLNENYKMYLESWLCPGF